MKDSISKSRVQLLHPKVRQLFDNFITDCENTFGITLRISMGLRTIKEQNDLYAQGRTLPGKILTNAKGGSSFHNYGLAVDLVHISDDGTELDWNYDTSKLLPISNKYNLEWGGSWTHIIDRPHFESRQGFLENCSDAFALVQQGKVDSNGYILIPNTIS